MKYCNHCEIWMKDEFNYCTECGSRLDDADCGYFEPGENIDIDINFYEQKKATVGNDGQSLEITLCRLNDTDAQLDIFYRSNYFADETRKTYTVDSSVIDKCYEAINATDVRNWEKRKDAFGMMGARYVLKFREGNALVRVSTDHCPVNETGIFFTIKNILLSAEKKVKQDE